LYETDTAKTSTSYIQWLEEEKKYYKVGDVHPYASGYELFGDAIIDAFETEGLDKFIAPVQKTDGFYCKSKAKYLTSSFNQMFVTDPRITYNGKWYICNKEDPKSNLTQAIDTKFYEYPYYPEGGAYTVMANAEMTFKSSAEDIYVVYIRGEETNDMVFLVDGEEVGTSSTAFSSATNMTYITHEVPVGKNKTVTIRAKNFAPLRILAIIERVAE
jgi:hypothetical protein